MCVLLFVNQAVQDDCAKIKEENIQLQHHVNNLEEDVYQLGDLVNKARLTSKLQVKKQA